MKARIMLSINNLDTAGMKYVLASIAFGLDSSRFTPLILVNKKTNSELEKKLEQHFAVHELVMRYQGIPNLILSLFSKIKQLRQYGNVIHSFDYSSDWYGALIAKFAGIPFITEKTNLSFNSWRWGIKFGLSDHIICLSSAQKNQLLKYQHKLSLIPTGVDITKFQNAEPVKRDAYNLKIDDIVLVAVAHLVEVKGLGELIQAVGILKGDFPNLKIVCVGKGDPEYERRLFRLCETNDVADRFIFTGNSDNVAGIMKMADGKILPTQNRGRKEAFGAVLVEAMAAGLPVIATRSGGPEDIVVEGETGWLVNGDGVNSLVEGIKTFMNSQNLWNKFGSNGQQRAIKFYSEGMMVKAYADVYWKLFEKTKHHSESGS